MGRLERAAAAERNRSSEKLGVILYYIGEDDHVILSLRRLHITKGWAKRAETKQRK
jgi:hypothetical protein